MKDGGRCVFPNCRKEVTLKSAHMHEVVWRSQGGDPLDLDNVVTTCATCHMGIHPKVGGVTKEVTGSRSAGLRFREKRADGSWADVVGVQPPTLTELEVEDGGGQLVQVGPAFLLDAHNLTVKQGHTVTFGDFEKATLRLVKVTQSIWYWTGDLLNLGENTFSEEASQVIDYESMSYETARQMQRVASQVPPENRQIAPSWTHALIVSPLSVPEQRKWLERAAEGDDGRIWSVTRLKAELAATPTEGKSTKRWYLVVEVDSEEDQIRTGRSARRPRVYRGEEIRGEPAQERAAPAPGACGGG